MAKLPLELVVTETPLEALDPNNTVALGTAFPSPSTTVISLERELLWFKNRQRSPDVELAVGRVSAGADHPYNSEAIATAETASDLKDIEPLLVSRSGQFPSDRAAPEEKS